jgi:hypothetical protein
MTFRLTRTFWYHRDGFALCIAGQGLSFFRVHSTRPSGSGSKSGADSRVAISRDGAGTWYASVSHRQNRSCARCGRRLARFLRDELSRLGLAIGADARSGALWGSRDARYGASSRMMKSAKTRTRGASARAGGHIRQISPRLSVWSASTPCSRLAARSSKT